MRVGEIRFDRDGLAKILDRRFDLSKLKLANRNSAKRRQFADRLERCDDNVPRLPRFVPLDEVLPPASANEYCNSCSSRFLSSVLPTYDRHIAR